MDKEIYEVLSFMKRMGQQVPVMNELDVLHEQRPLIVKEGLIQTYDTNRVVEMLAMLYGLKHKPGFNVNDKPDNTTNGEIWVTKPNGEQENIVVKLNNHDVFDNLNAHCLKYGWVNYRTDDNYYYFEKRFGDRFNAKQLKNMFSKIYHITSANLSEKVQKQGLVPKESKTPGFTNEPRTYFSLKKPTQSDVWNFNAMRGKATDGIVFEVDVEKLLPTQDFFYDARWEDSIYTFEPTPATALRLMDLNELEQGE